MRYPIGSMEQDTSIGQGTIWKCERRDGFLSQERNNMGECVYTAEQGRCLQVIQRLLDPGLRPGRVVPFGKKSLGDLADTLPVASAGDLGVNNAQVPLQALTFGGT